ncbi:MULTISPECIES: ThiF family adenylyltransferase [Staphylococcus]|uniref:ThiF family adenylyltransferase n=1 Tax=Staphylococcus TaxID=1279 RepID=UPI0008A8BC08|nr:MULTISPECIES: ThiF family adenylyltransferase [unclassified Staphylococcus]MDU3182670.1 ThiF family adenylyltransferase [Staphylococcus lugdunensis]MDU3708813.1 ThiF family adenylyltransferase [Staphylococcus lugdunensis]OHP84042.1 molybdopterin biosynthesis protein MoeB [Staphylococcus sp. HMSC063A07]OHQ42281.1 molybdopterin biosynthesis protein MoeB [Staphylococcus sp. HMSC069E09]
MTQDRYSRQILFNKIGEKGQEDLRQAQVLIVGMGALGTHLAEGLVRAGVKQLTIVDRDYIEYSNLQRQTLFTEQDAAEGLPKVIAAKAHLESIDKDVQIHAFIAQVDHAFLSSNGTHVDLILDATDNFVTRQLINDFCYQQHIPWIYGGVVQSTYVEAPFIPGKTPCFNCLIPQLPSMTLTCDTVGVIQPAVTMTTSLQLKDALKILTHQDIAAKLTYGDIWEGQHISIGFSKIQQDNCATCGTAANYPYLQQQPQRYAMLCGRDTVQYVNPDISQEMLVSYLGARQIDYQTNGYLVMFHFNKYRIVCFHDGRFLIHGMTNITQATKLINALFG